MRALKIFIFLCVWVVILPASSFAAILGPYSGQVLDSRTGDPIVGASVLFYWTKYIPQFHGGNSDLIKATLVYTDEQGKYKIPVNMASLGLLASFESTRVLVYQPGYQFYTVTIRAYDASGDSNRSFQKFGNRIRLERIPLHFDHRKHLDRINKALWGIDEVYLASDRAYPESIWEKHIKLNLRGVLEKEEFLRRVEWEDRR